MAKYANCTDKQIKELMRLEENAKQIKRKKDFINRWLNFNHTIGFEENIRLREQVKELDKEYQEVAAEIAEVYGAEEEMLKHMRLAMAEIDKVNEIRDKWGFPVNA